jgi:FecR-like protein
MRYVLTMAVALVASSAAFAGDDGVWSISKSSGEVWVTTSGAEQVSLRQEDPLKPGDVIRTGRNGRVLLVRGEETILVQPNSVIGLPTEKKDGMSTTILQQAGSILLEVEKRNVKHFEVETPYLAAVVKGTHFSVTVNATSTSVNVARGQVEVSDFKTGQIAQILPGQTATSFANGKGGLSLSGSGTFSPIEQGKPRPSSIDRIPVPRNGLTAPHNNAGDGKVIHAFNGHASFGKLANASAQTHQANDQPKGQAKNNVVHLSTALGEVHLNVGKATHGLAHGSVANASGGRGARDGASSTIWSDNKSSASNVNAFAQSGVSSATSAATATTAGAATSSTAAVAAAAATDSGSASNNGGGSASTGNGKTAANGNNGNGNGNNGNGNGGVGNGNGKGNAKH